MPKLCAILQLLSAPLNPVTRTFLYPASIEHARTSMPFHVRDGNEGSNSMVVRVSKFSSIFLLNWKIDFCEIVAKINILTLRIEKKFENWTKIQFVIFQFFS